MILTIINNRTAILEYGQVITKKSKNFVKKVYALSLSLHLALPLIKHGLVTHLLEKKSLQTARYDWFLYSIMLTSQIITDNAHDKNTLSKL